MNTVFFNHQAFFTVSPAYVKELFHGCKDKQISALDYPGAYMKNEITVHPHL
jgi:hypothetical protein